MFKEDVYWESPEITFTYMGRVPGVYWTVKLWNRVTFKEGTRQFATRCICSTFSTSQKAANFIKAEFLSNDQAEIFTDRTCKSLWLGQPQPVRSWCAPGLSSKSYFYVTPSVPVTFHTMWRFNNFPIRTLKPHLRFSRPVFLYVATPLLTLALCLISGFQLPIELWLLYFQWLNRNCSCLRTWLRLLGHLRMSRLLRECCEHTVQTSTSPEEKTGPQPN